MSRWEDGLAAVEAVMENRRKLAVEASDFCDTVRHIAGLVDGEAGLPARPILEAKEIALEEAYEAILLWRSAREEYRRRLASISGGPGVSKAPAKGAEGQEKGGQGPGVLSSGTPADPGHRKG